MATEKLKWPEDVEISQEALALLDHDDLYSVPEQFLEEIMASELVAHLRNYHTAVAARRAARQIGDNKRAEDLGRAIAYARNTIALITHEHAKVRGLAEEIMKLETSRARAARTAALGAEDGRAD